MKEFLKKLVPEKDHGLPISKCKPYVVMARATKIHSDVYRTESLRRNESSDSVSTKRVQFYFEIKGQEFCASEEFRVGDVTPNLGQWVRGVAVFNQWGSIKFTTTHLMKVEDDL